MAARLTAEAFVKKLKSFQSDEELKKIQRYFKEPPTKDDYFIGVRMGNVFELGKEFKDMPVAEIEKLMESSIHEVRAGAMSIMGQCTKGKTCSEERLKELYDLYIRRHDRINNWDLVDLAAYYVVGRYFADKPRDILYKLAKSKDTWERRTSIVATAHFIMKQKQVDDTFKIAEVLVNDKEDLVHKGTGWMLRAAGDVDRDRLLKFLDKHAATMPRVLLRYSIEKLDKRQRDHYLGMKKKGRSK
ncbi:MAG TPA: DNA alkylation repair protein [Pyrinomonadaceae bacterium]|jgi:3-methyladenine DNA glycosylase AlkD|nr:DNA alkylation repair protein [Pyrinomonadaceae bacterium]